MQLRLFSARRVLSSFCRGRRSQRAHLPQKPRFIALSKRPFTTKASEVDEPNEPSHVFEVSDTTWQRLVVEESYQTPVILDAWAEYAPYLI
jgi:hypothetical protein